MVQTPTTLIERVRNSEDNEDWREFVQLYEPLLVSIVRRRGLRDENDVYDVVQDVLGKLVIHIGSYDRSRGRFHSWLWRVTANVVSDFYRRNGRADSPLPDGFDPPDPNEKPDDDWPEEYRRRVLEFVLNNVRRTTSDTNWACFEGRILRRRPAAEIAVELGMKPANVYVYASRVLEVVREECRKYEEELSGE